MSEDSETNFDVVIIGAGPTGEHAADRCRRAGLSTALVEAELAGGECSYWACMPSKTLIRPTEVFHSARNVPGAREAVVGQLDARSALDRRDWVVSSWQDDGQVEWIKSVGATLYRGRGRLIGEQLVEVSNNGTTRRLRASRSVIIATGSESAIPPIEGLSTSRHWDNRGATSTKVVPHSFIVLGGGAVGVELAQAWRRLGSTEVTVIEGSDRLVPALEPFASALIKETFENEGIAVWTDAKAVKIDRPNDDAKVTVSLDDGRSVIGDELLVAVGRRPRSRDLGLEAFGLEAGRPIPVDDAMCVASVPGRWLYAIGDVNGRALLTHIGKYQARIAVGAIVGRDIKAVADRDIIPSVVFTDPIVASVGLTEKAARDKGLDISVIKVKTNSVAAAAIFGESVPGACQIVVDKDRHVIVGATFVGPDLADELHSATIAITGQVPMDRLYHAVPSFPTLSEVWLDLVEQYLESTDSFSVQPDGKS